MDKNRVYGAIIGFVIGVGAGIVYIGWLHAGDLNLVTKIAACGALGGLGAALGGIFGVQLT